MTANRTVTANFQQIYTLTVNRNPTTVSTTINVASTAYTTPREVNANTAISLSTTVPTGFRFVNWTVTGIGATIANATSATAATVTLTSGNVTVTANFQQVYTLTVNRNPTTVSSTISVASTAYTTHREVDANAAITLSTTVPTGFVFANWAVTAGTGATISNASSATAATVTLTSSNATVTANFTPVYTLTTNVTPTGGGTLTRNPTNSSGLTAGNYTAGTTVTVTPSAATGYRFNGWTGACSGTGTCVVTMTQNQTVTASFIQEGRILTVTSGIGGTATGGGTFSVGTNPIITASPTGSNIFINWTVTSGTATFGNANSATTTITLGSSTATVRANFGRFVAPYISPYTTPGDFLYTYNGIFPATIEVYALGAGGGGQGGHTSDAAFGSAGSGTGGAGGGGAAAYTKFDVTSGPAVLNIRVGGRGGGGGGVYRAVGQNWRSGYKGDDGDPTIVTWSGGTLTAAGGKGGGEGRAADLGTDATGRTVAGGSGGVGTYSGGAGTSGSNVDGGCKDSRGGTAASITEVGSLTSFGGGSVGRMECDPPPGLNWGAGIGAGGAGGWNRNNDSRPGGNCQVRIIITYFEPL